MPEPSIAERSAEKTRNWLDDLCDRLGTEDRRYAHKVLRAYLHALRDRLTVEESAQLAAQLPNLIRGIYYEGWKPSATPVHYHDLTDFLDRVAADAQLGGTTVASYAVGAAAEVLRQHISTGEIEDVLVQLPDALSPVPG